MIVGARAGLQHAPVRHDGAALAPTGALFTFIALWTGALWGKPTWGTYWAWDARLTSELILSDVAEDTPLLWTLRDAGTKFGCGAALCGACTIHIDDQPARSCVTPVSAAVGKRITTIEAIGATPAGKKVQAAWLALDVVQCGYCQSGQIMSATALLASNPKPSDADIDSAMAGNICRCGTYPRIRAAIKKAAGVSDKEV